MSSKVLSDELEEDEDFHNKLKCDQVISDEQITVYNAKISTLETSIFRESARLAQLTEDIDTMEKDLFAESEISEISKFSGATAIGGKQLVEYREANKAITEDIENSVLSQLKASFLSFQGTPDISSWTSQEQNVLNRAMKVSSSFVQSRGISKYVLQYASQSGEVLSILKQFLEEMNSDIAAVEAAELEHKKAFDELSDAKNEEIAASTQHTRRKASRSRRRNSRTIVTRQNWKGPRSPSVSRRHFLRISTLLGI